jgi:hypothetical protein
MKEEINITIQRNDNVLRLTEGLPDQLGITDASLYVAFVYTNVQVVVWASDLLDSYERRTVSRALLHLVQDRISSDSPDGRQASALQ